MTTLVGALAAPLLIFAMALPCHADSTCKDGTTSAATGRAPAVVMAVYRKAAKSAAAAAPASTEAASPAAAPAPAAAASKAAAGRKGGCDQRQHRSDGRHRQVQGRDLLEIEAPQGFCSHHGGVAEFLTQ